MPRKRLYSIIFGSLIGIGLLVMWFHYIDPAELLASIKQVRINYVIIAALIYLSAYFVRSVRWNIILRNQCRVSLIRTWLYSMGGNFVNYMIPIRLGEVVKAWFVKRNHDIGMIKVLPSIFIDKSFDTIAIFFILILIPFVSVKVSTAMTVLLLLLGLVFLVSLGIILFAARRKSGVVNLLQKLFSWLPIKIRAKANQYIELFIQGLNIFEHHWLNLVIAILLTALGVMLDGLYFFLIFKAFNISYPFALVLFGYTLINLSYALPQPPAQLGSNEWMMIIIFSIGFGLTTADASVIMAFAHVLTALLMSGVGLFAIGLSGHQILKAVFKGDKIYE
ncbi:MAG: lysylphosphatidylglycerol synthase transmembrane domain-containing protein [Candidatus Cloacimonadaceae bacterium]|nr:lysylphosphatidylglycerol synthase transmembrane domain-containing protein [Candidatus Cloacimonadaceae bacterium]MDP3113183.1 lysylphosphatidylglycerol synthase transmembrane domain-containing protein [Candidatus Cloacimonadaceae bacterium]